MVQLEVILVFASWFLTNCSVVCLAVGTVVMNLNPVHIVAVDAEEWGLGGEKRSEERRVGKECRP